MDDLSNPLGSSDASRIRFNIGAASSGINTDIRSVRLDYGGLMLKDSDTTNALVIFPDSDLTSDRILRIITGDADRTLTISGDVTLAGSVPTLAKGGLITNNGTVNTALPVGADTFILTADSTAGTGLKWAAAGAAGAHALLDGTVANDTLASAPVRGGIIVANSTPLWAQLALGSSGKILRSNGSDLVYTTATYPATTTANRILFSSATNTISEIATANSGVLVTDGSGVPSISTSIALADSGTITLTKAGLASSTTDLLTLSNTTAATGGNVTQVSPAIVFSGAYYDGSASRTGKVELYVQPTGNPINQIYLEMQFTRNASIVSTALAIYDGTNLYTNAGYGYLIGNSAPTTGTILRSNGTACVATTATYPATTTANRILFSSSSNVIGEITSANSGVLVTDGSGVPSISSTLPSGLTIPGFAASGSNGDITALSGLTGAVSKPTSITVATGAGLRTDTGAGNTLLIQARDVDGAAYTTFITFTANNTPTCDLDDAVTKAGAYIYRAGGTDVATADGGTGLSSGTSGGILGFTASGTIASSAALTAKALVIGGGAGATPTTIAALTNGQLAIGSTGANPVPATLTGADTVSITNAAGSITVGDVTNADTGAFIILPTPYSQAAAATGAMNNAVANKVVVYRFYLPFKHTFTKITFKLTFAIAGSTSGVGVYSADGNTLLLSGTIATASGLGMKVVTVSGTLSPGFYLYATTSTHTGVLVAVATPEITHFTGVLNDTVTCMGTAANLSSVGALPATLGALTAVDFSIPIAKLQ